MNNQKKVFTGIGIGLVLVLLVGVLVWPGTGETATALKETMAPRTLLLLSQRRTLSDEITVRGEIRRDQLQRITANVDGQVSSVLVDDGDTINAGDILYAIDGRAVVAVDGEFSFRD